MTELASAPASAAASADFRPIADYALLADCQSAALVSRSGSIDWLCLPRFDSESCFAALLGKPGDGRWLLAPAGTVRRTHRRYLDDTIVLETAHETPEGVVTVADWRAWASRCTYKGPHAKLVMRSLLTLKALTYAPTGGIAAAATTSLPEWPGGVRNWDYRFCWLRDATFTLLSLLSAGYSEE